MLFRTQDDVDDILHKNNVTAPRAVWWFRQLGLNTVESTHLQALDVTALRLINTRGLIRANKNFDDCWIQVEQETGNIFWTPLSGQVAARLVEHGYLMPIGRDGAVTTYRYSGTAEHLQQLSSRSTREEMMEWYRGK